MTILLTGGAGFLGAALCKQLLDSGHRVRVFDDASRGSWQRLSSLGNLIERADGDIRDRDAVLRATRGCSQVWHLAYINGTEHFYNRPDDVLEVAVKGTVNTIDAALEAGAERYVFASSSEVYNQPAAIPTPVDEGLRIPDVTNPRFSYGGGKITGELLTLHYARKRGLEAVIFRPHNFYGPEMGHEHVIPQIVRRIVELSAGLTHSSITLPIQGDGSETRAFCYIDDGARQSLVAGRDGEDGAIFHLGTQEEVTIRELIEKIGALLEVDLTIEPGERLAGSTPRRCPDTSLIRALDPQEPLSLDDGLARTVAWYRDHYVSQRGEATEASDG